MKAARGAGHALTAVSLLLCASAAAAQDSSYFARDRNVSVMARRHPELEPYGIRIGDFIAMPSVTTAIAYDDNIYAQEADRRTDFIATIQPAISVTSDWSRHALGFDASLTRNQYLKTGTESTTNYSVDANGRLDIGGGTISASVSSDSLTEARTVVDAPGAARRPIRYHDVAANLSAAREFGRFRLVGSIDWHRFRYQDATSITGGILDQSYRNRDTVTGEGRIEYAMTPAISMYLDGTVNQRDYAQSPTSFGRDSHGYTVEAGSDFDITHLVRGHVQLGYLSQTARSATWSAHGFSGRGKVEWFATPLVTVTIEGGRSVRDSALSDSAAYMATDVSARADYELLRSLIISATAGFEKDRFEGTGQRATQINGGLMAQYRMGRRVVLDLSALRVDQRTPRDSTLRRFDDDRITLSLRFQI